MSHNDCVINKVLFYFTNNFTKLVFTFLYKKRLYKNKTMGGNICHFQQQQKSIHVYIYKKRDRLWTVEKQMKGIVGWF